MVWKIALATVIGGAVGFGLQRLVGCPDGGCPLMRTPLTGILYGAVVGLLMSFI